MTLAVENIPEGWEVESLKSLSLKLTDGSHNPPKKQEAGKPMLSAKNIENGLINWDASYRFITEEDFDQEDKRTSVEAGDVLLTIVGTIGRTCVIPSKFERFTLQRSVAVIKPNLLDSKFVCYQLQSPRVQNYLFSNSKGTAQKGIYLKGLGALPILVAPPEQQKRIVAKIEELFSHVDAGIAALNKSKQLLKQYRQSVLKAAVTGELTKQWREENKDKLEPASELLERINIERLESSRSGLVEWKVNVKKWEETGKDGKKPTRPKKYKEFSPDDVDSDGVPFGWVTAPLIASAKIDIGFAFKSKEFVSDGIALLRGDNIEPGSLRWVNKKCWPEEKLPGFEHLFIDEGDVILAMDRPVISSGLKIAIAKKEDLPALLVQRVARIRSEASSCSKYIHYALSTESFINHCLGSQTGTQLPHISGAQIEGYKFGLPSVEEQKVIVDELENRLNAIKRIGLEIDRQSVKAEKNKQAILASAFSGNLVDQLETDGSAKDLIEKITSEAKKYAQKSKTKRVKKKANSPMKKRSLLSVLEEHVEGISPDNLMQEVGFLAEEVDEFYQELSEIGDRLVQDNLSDSEKNSWPYDSSVKLKLKDK